MPIRPTLHCRHTIRDIEYYSPPGLRDTSCSLLPPPTWGNTSDPEGLWLAPRLRALRALLPPAGGNTNGAAKPVLRCFSDLEGRFQVSCAA